MSIDMFTCPRCGNKYPDFIRTHETEDGTVCDHCIKDEELTHKVVNVAHKPDPGGPETLGRLDHFALEEFKNDKSLQTVTVVNAKGELTYRRKELDVYIEGEEIA